MIRLASSLVAVAGVVAAAAAPAAAVPAQAPAFLLGNTALPGVSMPASGLGTGCAIGGCKWPLSEDVFDTAENMSLSFFAMGGRRIDDADSYGLAQGVARAIAKAGVNRSELFIVSKTGPGGLSFPLGFNETLQQARGIVANYSAAGSVSAVDLLLVHWPVNYGPCSYHGPKPSVPTTDPLCDTARPTYDEAGCRLSSWRGALAAFDAGLARAVGVSNFNSTHIEDIAAAGLRLPSVNQVSFSPVHGPGHVGCTPAGSVETCGDLLATCRKFNVTFNGYSPFGGAQGAGALLSDARLVAMGAKYDASPSQVVLSWQYKRHGVAVNPEARNATYQRENLFFFVEDLSDDDMDTLDNWSSPLTTLKKRRGRGGQPNHGWWPQWLVGPEKN